MPVFKIFLTTENQSPEHRTYEDSVNSCSVFLQRQSNVLTAQNMDCQVTLIDIPAHRRCVFIDEEQQNSSWRN